VIEQRGVAGIADEVRSGRRTAGAVVGAALDRAHASQAALNAFILIDDEGASARADAVDAVVAGGGDPGPLAGVPVALKDLIDQAGLPNTLGAAFEPSVPERSATVVERLEAAGAVIIGRTGLHEFAFGFSSENQHFGPVRNPWNPDLSPGGSSGGSAAAVAAGIVPVGIGTDTGGSIRVPAALCGVVGLKVTHGRVPLTGVYPLAPSLDTVGPMTRSVADAAAVLAVIAGDDPLDPWSSPRPVEEAQASPSLAGRTFGYVAQWIAAPRVGEVRAAFHAALEDLVDAGALVVEIDEPALAVPRAVGKANGVEIAAVHRERWEADRSRYGSDVAARLEASFTVPGDDLVAALRWAAGAGHVLERRFATIDAIVTPTVGATRKPIGVDDIDVDGEPVFYRRLLAETTAPVNRLGLPALALPLPDRGVIPPASLQLIGPAWGEALLLALGTALEAGGVARTGTPSIWFGP
jgi:Asp-tRNA(Asn)/Glu-tRNA(Gln) amidotransferase A subunit family amidase